MDLSPLPPAPSVAVVVPARDSAATLETAVRSALSQEVPGDLEVVIAVGPSADDTEAVAARLAGEDERVRWIANPAGITPVGLNAAIAASTGEVVVRLDAHARLEPGYIATAVEVLRDTGAANVGGTQRPVADAGFARAVAAAMASPVGAGGAAYRTGRTPADVETVYLGVFRREALDRVGGYDPALVRNQDYELNHRLREAGGRVHFHPALAVDYRPRGSIRALARQYHDYGAWKRVVLRRHPSSVKLRQLVAPALVLALAGAVVLAVVWSPVPLAALVAVYVLALGGAGMQAAGRATLALPTAAALATMHLAWGTGFLVGRAAAPAPRGTPPRPDPSDAGSR
ncbi:MAG: glycosyltransferase family 2 protein [Actinobacteria bacterium]|nr:glycosyltransferase family 2 protein [Actinomycetota bacterium]